MNPPIVRIGNVRPVVSWYDSGGGCGDGVAEGGGRFVCRDDERRTDAGCTWLDMVSVSVSWSCTAGGDAGRHMDRELECSRKESVSLLVHL